jgi:hypothetical protein
VAAVLIATGGTKSFCVFQVAIEPINRAATRSSTGIGAAPIAGSDAIVFGSLISRVSGRVRSKHGNCAHQDEWQAAYFHERLTITSK